MKRRVIAGAVLALGCICVESSQVLGQQAPPEGGAGRGQATAAPVTPASLAGTWKSAEERTPLTTPFNQSVWGAGAAAVRTVELVVQKDGAARLTVTRKVVDAKGRTVPASPSVEEAQITIGEGKETIGGRVEHAVRVTSAERRYPDDPKSKWPLEGLGVKVVSFSDPGMLEVRFDTPEGTGSFWETLRRSAASSKPSSTASEKGPPSGSAKSGSK